MKNRKTILILVTIIVVLLVVWKFTPLGQGGSADSATPQSDINLPTQTPTSTPDNDFGAGLNSTPVATEVPTQGATPKPAAQPTMSPMLSSQRYFFTEAGVTYHLLPGFAAEDNRFYVTQYLSNFSVAFYLEIEMLTGEDPLDGAIEAALKHNEVTYKPEEAYAFELDGISGKRYDFFAKDQVGNYTYKGSVIAIPVNASQAFVLSGYGFTRFGSEIWEEVGIPAFDALLSGVDILPPVQ